MKYQLIDQVHRALRAKGLLEEYSVERARISPTEGTIVAMLVHNKPGSPRDGIRVEVPILASDLTRTD